MALQTLQVMCITKWPTHRDPHERIQGIGGVDRGVRWWHLENVAIANIEANRVDYFVSVNGRRVDVVVKTLRGRKFLTTEPDGYVPNNLLSLPECPR